VSNLREDDAEGFLGEAQTCASTQGRNGAQMLILWQKVCAFKRAKLPPQNPHGGEGVRVLNLWATVYGSSLPQGPRGECAQDPDTISLLIVRKAVRVPE
jgi:hypothetical protein